MHRMVEVVEGEMQPALSFFLSFFCDMHYDRDPDWLVVCLLPQGGDGFTASLAGSLPPGACFVIGSCN